MPIFLDDRFLVPVHLPNDEHLEEKARVTFYARPLTASRRLNLAAILDKAASDDLPTAERIDLHTQALRMLIVSWRGRVALHKDVGELRDILTPGEMATLIFVALQEMSMAEADVKKFVSPSAFQTAPSVEAATERPESPVLIHPDPEALCTSGASLATPGERLEQNHAKPAVGLAVWP